MKYLLIVIMLAVSNNVYADWSIVNTKEAVLRINTKTGDTYQLSCSNHKCYNYFWKKFDKKFTPIKSNWKNRANRVFTNEEVQKMKTVEGE